MKKIFLFLVVLTLPISAFTESEQAEMPKTGTLAATTNVPMGQATQDGPVGGNSLDDATVNPLTASMSRVSATEYDYTVFNNSDDQYSVSLDLIANDVSGRTVRKTSSSVNLAAGKSVTRSLRVPSNTANVSIEMRNWTKKSKEASNDQVLAEIEAKKAEIRELETKLSSTTAEPVLTK